MSNEPAAYPRPHLVQRFQDRLSWYVGVSAYWFATSMKWFVLLLVVLPAQVESVVPENQKNTYWGSVFMIGAVWAVFGPALFGGLSDRFASKFGKRRPFIALGAGLTVVALMVLAQVRQGGEAVGAVNLNAYILLVVGYLLLQVSDDVGTGPYSAIVPELVPQERRGKASGILGLARLLAQVVGGVAVFATGGNWLTLYLVLALVNVLFAVWTIATLQEDRTERMSTEAGESFWASWMRPWSSADFRWIFASSFLLALAFYLVQPYLRNYLNDVVRDFGPLGTSVEGARGFSESASSTAAAFVALVISLFGAFGAILSARLADRTGRKRVVYISGALMFATLVPFGLFPNFTLILLLAMFFGFGYGARLSAEWALVSDVLPDASKAGAQMGIWQMSNSSVQILAGGSGALIDKLNSLNFGLGYQLAFLAAAVLFGISTLLVKRVRGSR